MKNISKRIGVHIWADIHEDVQMQRYNSTMVACPDFHFILSLENPVSIQDFRDIFDLEVMRFLPDGGSSKIDDYTLGLNDIGYTFNTHEQYYEEIYCPHKTKCRRKGCVHKRGLNKASVFRT